MFKNVPLETGKKYAVSVRAHIDQVKSIFFFYNSICSSILYYCGNRVNLGPAWIVLYVFRGTAV